MSSWRLTVLGLVLLHVFVACRVSASNASVAVTISGGNNAITLNGHACLAVPHNAGSGCDVGGLNAKPYLGRIKTLEIFAPFDAAAVYASFAEQRSCPRLRRTGSRGRRSHRGSGGRRWRLDTRAPELRSTPCRTLGGTLGLLRGGLRRFLGSPPEQPSQGRVNPLARPAPIVGELSDRTTGFHRALRRGSIVRRAVGLIPRNVGTRVFRRDNRWDAVFSSSSFGRSRLVGTDRVRGERFAIGQLPSKVREVVVLPGCALCHSCRCDIENLNRTG